MGGRFLGALVDEALCLRGDAMTMRFDVSLDGHAMNAELDLAQTLRSTIEILVIV
jgi:hypothetical protein